MGADRRGGIGARNRPKTYARWLKAALLANGIVAPGPRTPLCELQDAASMLVATGRAPHPRRWVDALIAVDREARAANLPHNLC